MTTPYDRLLGSKVTPGDIAVGKLLGKGGFGVVHEATITGIQFPFAIKFLDPSPFNPNADVARARFTREAELLFRLRHPHILAIYGVGEHHGVPYILMERFDGLDLNRARSDHGTPEPAAVLPFIEFVAGALGFAHSAGVVHRDIKPSNLMTRKGDARVLDFGIAALLDPDGSRLTRTGGTCVGDAFSAPELSENPRLCDPRCDVYSLGACWFWLLTGKAPKGLNWEAALRSAVKVTPDYERVVLRCLDQAEARYASMGELCAEVHALRCGEKPRAGLDDVNDDDSLVLGVIASACPTRNDSTTVYQVEQELKGGMSRLAMGIAYRRLIRLNLVETFIDTDPYSEFTGLRLTDAGDQWVEAHQKHIATLIDGMARAATKNHTPPAADDDVPF